MITADKARAISDLNNSESCIQNKIEEATRKGSYYTYIPGLLSKHIQNVLKDNGFAITEAKVDSNYVTRISWD